MSEFDIVRLLWCWDIYQPRQASSSPSRINSTTTPFSCPLVRIAERAFLYACFADGRRS